MARPQAQPTAWRTERECAPVVIPLAVDGTE
jgi:hypothetical protein